MDAIEDIVGELVTRSKTKKLNAASIRAEFHRSCLTHFTGVVLPELKRFESHLGDQGLSIFIDSLQPVEKNVIQASMIVEYPADINNVLDIRYDCSRQELGFYQLIGGRSRSQADKKYPFELMNRLSSPKVYDIIETFAAAVFGAKLM